MLYVHPLHGKLQSNITIVAEMIVLLDGFEENSFHKSSCIPRDGGQTVSSCADGLT